MVRLDEIFEIRYGNGLELLNCDEDENGIPFVSRTSSNNGVVSKVSIKDDIEPMPPYAITVALGGSVLSSFFQTENFYTSFHIFCLYPKIKLTETEMIYYCVAIEKNRYRYSYGRQANKTLKNILVPSVEEIPKRIKSFKSEDVFIEKPLLENKLPLETEKWKWFRYDEVFYIKNGFFNKKPEISENGNVLFIGATDSNNGITSYHTIEDIEQTPKAENTKNVELSEKIFKDNCITVSNNGSVGFAFYQSTEFTCSHDINPLYLKEITLNKYIAIFFCSLIEKEQYRWAYGRKWRPARMPSSKIKLPITTDGTPDWQFMESYIKSLPYSANL